MENRMWLFENFCFPTVVSQSNKNFKWLLFDENTKEIYKNRIEKLVENHPHFVVLYKRNGCFLWRIDRLYQEKF
jgi:hypothetical protein